MSTPFEDAYRRLFARLGVELRSDDGCSEAIIAEAERRLAVAAPAALRSYYLVAGLEERLNCAHNRLISPDEWFTDAGHLAFLEENQTVVFWGVATTPQDDDPPVEQGVNGDVIAWYAEHDQCSVFLMVMLAWQAVMGGLGRTWSATVDDGFSTALQRWTAVGAINELQAYTRDGVALCCVPWSDGPRIFVSSAEPARVEALAKQLAVEWDRDYE